MSGMLDAILQRGTSFVVADFGRQAALTRTIRDLVIDAVDELAGAAARAALSRDGLGLLHEHLPAAEIGALRDRVMPALRPELFRFACELGEELLDIDHEFFVDDYTILRVNYPYEVSLDAPATAENPGIGRVDPAVRGMTSSTQQRDAIYDPKGYHGQTPPASWAHGPHKDTWTGHSRNGINLWWAIEEVVEENSMVLYPETFGRAFEVDPRSLFVAAGQRMPTPRKMALHTGELLVFNPEVLHATHLNVSGRTRLAVSVRLNPFPPRFDPGCFYAREFWHSSLDVKDGRVDVIRQFTRDEHLEDPSQRPAELPQQQPQYRVVNATAAPDGSHRVALEALDSTAERQLITLHDGRTVALFRDESRWLAAQSNCPHLDLTLMDGHRESAHIHCPAHGVTFDLESGCSASRLLRLETYVVDVDGASLRLRRRGE